jgi:hypothetical protein
MAPPKSSPTAKPAAAAESTEPPAWMAAVLGTLTEQLGQQFTAQQQLNEQQIAAAISRLESAAPGTPVPPLVVEAQPPAPALRAAGLAALFEAADSTDPADLEAAIQAAVLRGGVDQEALQQAIAEGDLEAANLALYPAKRGGRGRGSDAGGGGGGFSGSGGGIRASATAQAAAAAEAAEAAAAAEAGEQEYELLDQLGELEPYGAADDDSYAQAFMGHPLPLPPAGFSPALPHGNPFVVSAPFQGTTSHYHPGRVGDHQHGAMADRLVAAGCSANAMEVRTLVSTLRAQIDLRESLRATARQLATQVGNGSLPPVLAQMPQLALDQLTQCNSIVEHLLERLAILRALSNGHASDLALYNQVYDGEQRMSGAMGKLESRVERTRLNRTVGVLTQQSGKEHAAEALQQMQPSLRPPKPPPGKQRPQRPPRTSAPSTGAQTVDVAALAALIKSNGGGGGRGGGGAGGGGAGGGGHAGGRADGGKSDGGRGGGRDGGRGRGGGRSS